MTKTIHPYALRLGFNRYWAPAIVLLNSKLTLNNFYSLLVRVDLLHRHFPTYLRKLFKLYFCVTAFERRRKSYYCLHLFQLKNQLLGSITDYFLENNRLSFLFTPQSSTARASFLLVPYYYFFLFNLYIIFSKVYLLKYQLCVELNYLQLYSNFKLFQKNSKNFYLIWSHFLFFKKSYNRFRLLYRNSKAQLTAIAKLFRLKPLRKTKMLKKLGRSPFRRRTRLRKLTRLRLYLRLIIRLLRLVNVKLKRRVVAAPAHRSRILNQTFRYRVRMRLHSARLSFRLPHFVVPTRNYFGFRFKAGFRSSLRRMTAYYLKQQKYAYFKRLFLAEGHRNVNVRGLIRHYRINPSLLYPTHRQQRLTTYFLVHRRKPFMLVWWRSRPQFNQRQRVGPRSRGFFRGGVRFKKKGRLRRRFIRKLKRNRQRSFYRKMFTQRLYGQALVKSFGRYQPTLQPASAHSTVLIGVGNRLRVQRRRRFRQLQKKLLRFARQGIRFPRPKRRPFAFKQKLPRQHGGQHRYSRASSKGKFRQKFNHRNGRVRLRSRNRKGFVSMLYKKLILLRRMASFRKLRFLNYRRRLVIAYRRFILVNGVRRKKRRHRARMHYRRNLAFFSKFFRVVQSKNYFHLLFLFIKKQMECFFFHVLHVKVFFYLKNFIDYARISRKNFAYLKKISRKIPACSTVQKYNDYFELLNLLYFSFVLRRPSLLNHYLVLLFEKQQSHRKLLVHIQRLLIDLPRICPYLLTYRIRISGKFNGRLRTSRKVLWLLGSNYAQHDQSLKTKIAYDFTEVSTYTGVFGIHTWFYYS